MASSQQLLLGQVAQGGYQISRSLRFNSADSAYLNRTPASASNRKTWTWSGWVKRSALGASSAVLFSANTASGTTGYTALFFQGGVDNFYFETRESGSGKVVETTAKYRDPSAWYHFVLAVDTSQGTAADRVKMYVNGVQITSFSTQNTITQDFLTSVNDTVSHDIGVARNSGGTRVGYYNGYLTEINFIDGQALAPSSFGETDTDTGVWKPKKYTGTYGTNGFYLNFSDNASTTTLGDDLSGNGNDWTTNNFSVTAGAGNDSLVDTPTNYGTDTGVGGEVRGNYCTLNPLSNDSTNTLTNGNLDYSIAANQNGYPTSTFQFSSGKWYWECTVTSTHNIIGIVFGTTGTTTTLFTTGYGYYYTGNKYVNGVSSAYGASYTTNDVIGVAVDLDSGTPTITFYKNGSSQGAITIAAGTYKVGGGNGNSGATATGTFNFGQRPFAYTAPSGFKALCTQNLPEPTIVDGGDYFNTILYTGTGSSNALTGVGFQPDWVWIKSRSAATDHGLYDAVRGVQKQLESNTTTAETTETTGLTAFGSDGFTVGALAQLNTSSATYVAWNWKANGSGVSNTDGTITSTVSANTTSGVSIVTFAKANATNETVGHGLGVAPAMFILKVINGAGNNWTVWHKSLPTPTTQRLVLNLTNAVQTDSTYWQSTLPSSTVVSLGVAWSAFNMIMYCFAPVAGYSAMSSFTGNGSADGPFIFTNHRPAFVLIKRTDTTSNWTILDFQREGYNVDNDPLYPNLSNAEGTTDLADLLSNGFKLRTTDASVNASGGTYIYMSLASNPFKFSLAR